ncbi:MAG: hypothetical protein J2P54_10760 [Bradyrhizobiaceae bacterium]|nr:hypothetical protein [Bradyrhizobiaceae bacterium]
MAELDEDTQNLLVVGALEVLTDTPQWIARTRKGLDGGNGEIGEAIEHFEFKHPEQQSRLIAQRSD